MKVLNRAIKNEFLKWLNSPIRSPLLLIGPRQTGKTTVLKNFAKEIGQNTFEINFWEDNNQTLKNIFKQNGNPKKILEHLADYFQVAKIDTKEDVLFIDEIQECPEAYSSLKNFKEKYPELKILATGSYLQLFLKNEEVKKLPVGCVDEFSLGPLSFSEFLENSDSVLFEKYSKLKIHDFSASLPLHINLMEKLNEYFFTGGLPEVVFLYLTSSKDFKIRSTVRKKQKDLLHQYVLDFQKYGKSLHVKKIDKIFEQIPLQLERSHEESTERFSFKDLGKNTKYNTLHWSFQFLKNSGLIIRSFIVSKIDIPFRVHEQLEARNIFKCFYFDLGLLGAALNSTVNFKLENLGSYKGYIAENFVAISLFSQMKTELVTYKKSSKNDSAEVEFILYNEELGIIPIEVKSSKKSLSSKSLDSFVKTYNPKVAYKLVPVLSEKGQKAKRYISIPLYMIDRILSELQN